MSHTFQHAALLDSLQPIDRACCRRLCRRLLLCRRPSRQALFHAPAVYVNEAAPQVDLAHVTRRVARVVKEMGGGTLTCRQLQRVVQRPLAVGHRAAHWQVAGQDGVARGGAERGSRVHVSEAHALFGDLVHVWRVHLCGDEHRVIG